MRESLSSEPPLLTSQYPEGLQPEIIEAVPSAGMLHISLILRAACHCSVTVHRNESLSHSHLHYGQQAVLRARHIPPLHAHASTRRSVAHSLSDLLAFALYTNYGRYTDIHSGARHICD